MKDDIRERAFEFARKNADNWSADDIDNLASLLASERAAAEDRVQARTQNEIVATLAALVGPDNVASGDGCDSGDALDWTVACVSLTIRKILDRHEEALLSERAAALGAAVSKILAAQTAKRSAGVSNASVLPVSFLVDRISALSPEGWRGVREADLAVVKEAAGRWAGIMDDQDAPRLADSIRAALARLP